MADLPERPPLPADRLEEILEHIRFLSSRNFLWATEGNFSLKDTNGFWITPRDKEKQHLAPDDFVWVPLEGEVPREASSEWPFHRIIHTFSPVRVVYHTHPPYTVAASAVLGDLYPPTLEEVRLLEGVIPVVQGPTGTEKLAEALRVRVVEGYRSIIIRNHGLVTLGDHPQEAFHRTLRVEREFQILTLRRLWKT